MRLPAPALVPPMKLPLALLKIPMPKPPSPMAFVPVMSGNYIARDGAGAADEIRSCAGINRHARKTVWKRICAGQIHADEISLNHIRRRARADEANPFRNVSRNDIAID